MPLTNNASYIPTMGEFIAHWNQVNADLNPDLVVATPDKVVYTFPDFITLRGTLQTQQQIIIGYLNDKEIARGDIQLRKARMLLLFNEFNAMLDAFWVNTPYANGRPYAPTLTDGQQTFLNPMIDMRLLWEKMNAGPVPAGLTLPLVLSGNTTVVAFAALIQGMIQAYINEADAQQNLVLARARRDITMASARAVMVAYRKVVPARCTAFPALIAAMPTLTPPPGHTPDPVNASAVFVAPDKAKIVHDASTDAKLARYELRGNPGDKYDDDDAVIIASHTPTEPREFVTTFGLTQPGTEIAVKLFVVLDTGNESGSATMVVSRPGE